MPEIWLACHGPLSCNSGNHVRSLAGALTRRGLGITVCVPERSSADADVPAGVRLLSFAEAAGEPLSARPDLVHLWTARERMRRWYDDLVARFGPLAFVLHLEDNEVLLLRQQMGLTPHDIDDIRDGLRPLDAPDHLTHPLFGGRMLGSAAGVTALIESLLDDVPSGMPTAVFSPGFDPIFAAARPAAAEVVRRRLGIPADHALITYTGNVHASNVDEVRSLMIAVALANRTGLPMTLIRTGIDHVPLADHGADLLAEHIVALGTVPRADLPDLVHAADILVQPGRVDEWNACRVPSKLPDFLVSGRPVILPRVNLGLVLEHGHNAIVLPEATAERIVAAFHEWLPRHGQLTAIGAAGREFAQASLTWDSAAETVAALYGRVLGVPAAAVPSAAGP